MLSKVNLCLSLECSPLAPLLFFLTPTPIIIIIKINKNLMVETEFCQYVLENSYCNGLYRSLSHFIFNNLLII